MTAFTGGKQLRRIGQNECFSSEKCSFVIPRGPFCWNEPCSIDGNGNVGHRVWCGITRSIRLYRQKSAIMKCLSKPSGKERLYLYADSVWCLHIQRYVIGFKSINTAGMPGNCRHRRACCRKQKINILYVALVLEGKFVYLQSVSAFCEVRAGEWFRSSAG